MFKKLYRKTFFDENNNFVIAQFPNLPIILALVFTILSNIDIFNAGLNEVFTYLASGFLFVWAYLEITSGVNYFRRFLGIAVIVYAIFVRF